MKISSISSEVGVALHPAALIKRADSTAGETATFANRPTNRSEPVFIAAELGPAHGSNQDEGERAIPPVVNGQGQALKFSVDEETGQQIITVIDLESGEIIRQIPQDEVLNFSRQLEQRKGLMLSIKS